MIANDIHKRLRKIAREYNLELWYRWDSDDDHIIVMFMDINTNHICKFSIVVCEIEDLDESFGELNLYVRNEFKRYDTYHN